MVNIFFRPSLSDINPVNKTPHIAKAKKSDIELLANQRFFPLIAKYVGRKAAMIEAVNDLISNILIIADKKRFFCFMNLITEISLFSFMLFSFLSVLLNNSLGSCQ